MIVAGAVLLASLGGGGGAGSAAHPAAFSRLTIRLEPDALRLELRLQELTLREVPSWWLDGDGDGRYSTLEVGAAWPRIAALLEERMWFEIDGEQRAPAWSVAAFEDPGDPLPDGGSWFEILVLQAELPRPADPRALAVHSDLFVEDGNPEHRLHVMVEGLWDEPVQTLLDYAHRDWTLEFPTALGTIGSYARLGFEHVLIGWDHLAFLAALLLGVAGFGALLGAVTAFTLAHSLTLALAASGLLRLRPDVVEPGIAWSVLLVALLHLRLGPSRARAWAPAFLFGLLHGCGFAGVLGEIGLPRTAEAEGLIGFNLGVEFGQLAFVVPLVAAAAAARRFLPRAWPALRQGGGLVVLAFALLLVGAAMRTAWWPRLPLPGRPADFLLGAAAAAAAGAAVAAAFRPGPGAPRFAGLLGQAALLAGCYAAGAWISGLRA